MADVLATRDNIIALFVETMSSAPSGLVVPIPTWANVVKLAAISRALGIIFFLMILIFF
jgi:hypothetical protein